MLPLRRLGNPERSVEVQVLLRQVTRSLHGRDLNFRAVTFPLESLVSTVESLLERTCPCVCAARHTLPRSVWAARRSPTGPCFRASLLEVWPTVQHQRHLGACRERIAGSSPSGLPPTRSGSFILTCPQHNACVCLVQEAQI